MHSCPGGHRQHHSCLRPPCPDSPLLAQVDSYGGSLRYKVRYELARGPLEPVERPDVILVGAGHRLLSRGHTPTHPGTLNQRQVQFSEVGGARALGAGWWGRTARVTLTRDPSLPAPGALGT